MKTLEPLRNYGTVKIRTVDTDKTRVVISRFVEKQLARLPHNILSAFYAWAEAVRVVGLRRTRMSRGYHDEPLKGKRLGQRSVRLNKAYRAIYIETKESIEIEVIEVHKHDY